jgi:hypothetical protein
MPLKANKTDKKHLLLDWVTRIRYVMEYGVQKTVEYKVKTWRCPHCGGEVFKGTRDSVNKTEHKVK